MCCTNTQTVMPLNFEDLGKKLDTCSFEAFIVEDDYTECHDNLRKACAGDGFSQPSGKS
jgi:prophage DNA circulation protein